MAVLARGLTEHGGAANVRLDEGEGIHQRTVDVRLGREVHDCVRLRSERVDQLLVADVAMDEAIPGLSVELGQVGEVPRVSELVEHSDLDVWARAAKMTDEIRSDETSRPRDQEPLQPPGHLTEGPAVQS